MNARHKRENGIIFEAYLCEMQEAINRSWRITPEAIARYAEIANFQAKQQTMWIHARQDPAKQWLQMRYYIIEGDVDMVISEWLDKWRIQAITREMPKNNTRGRGRAGRNVAFKNPSAQETQNGPRKEDTNRQRPKEERDLEEEEGKHTNSQGTTKIG
jgi:hypothetical protein